MTAGFVNTRLELRGFVNTRLELRGFVNTRLELWVFVNNCLKLRVFVNTCLYVYWKRSTTGGDEGLRTRLNPNSAHWLVLVRTVPK